MKRLLKLREDRKAHVAKMRGMLDTAGDQDLAAEQDAEYKGLEAKLGQLDAAIAREESLAAAEDKNAVTAGAAAATRATAVVEVHDEQPKFATFGDYLVAVGRAYRGLPIDNRLYGASGMSEGVGPDGGFAVQKDFLPEILQPVYETGALLSRVRRIPISNNANGTKFNVVTETSRATGSRQGGVQMYWLGEGNPLIGSQTKLEKVELDLKKLGGLFYATDELLEDASQLQALALPQFVTETQFTTEDSVYNGNGKAKPLGILNAPCLVTVAIEATQTIANSNQFIATNLTKMRTAFQGRWSDAVIFYNIELLPTLMLAKLDASSGAVPLFIPAGGLGDAQFDRVMGRPAVPLEYCAAVGTPGDLMIADPSQYALADKSGIRQDASMHVKFLTDEMTYRIIYRVDGQPIPRTSVTPYKGAQARSPFVVLNTRS